MTGISTFMGSSGPMLSAPLPPLGGGGRPQQSFGPSGTAKCSMAYPVRFPRSTLHSPRCYLSPLPPRPTAAAALRHISLLCKKPLTTLPSLTPDLLVLPLLLGSSPGLRSKLFPSSPQAWPAPVCLMERASLFHKLVVGSLVPPFALWIARHSPELTFRVRSPSAHTTYVANLDAGSASWGGSSAGDSISKRPIKGLSRRRHFHLPRTLHFRGPQQYPMLLLCQDPAKRRQYIIYFPHPPQSGPLNMSPTPALRMPS
jgi:hypothetical protein